MEGLEREREYVVGDWAARNSPDKKLKGGIERFKEGVHGHDLKRVGMIGFIQRENFGFWLEKVNEWISELISTPVPRHLSKWDSQDCLVVQPSSSTGVHESTSCHARISGDTISILHFRLDLTKEAQANRKAGQ